MASNSVTVAERSGARKKANRPTRVRSGENLPGDIDGRRATGSREQQRMHERARKYQETLAENVRILRTSRGWSQQHLANLVGWFRTTIIRIETGERCPSFSQMCVLADVFGVSVDLFSKDLSWLFSCNNAGSLPEAMRAARLSMNQTQEHVAESCGMTRAHYIKIESGKESASPEDLQKLAKAFGRDLVFADVNAVA